jgi:hypothetical protein
VASIRSNIPKCFAKFCTPGDSHTSTQTCLIRHIYVTNLGATSTLLFHLISNSGNRDTAFMSPYSRPNKGDQLGPADRSNGVTLLPSDHVNRPKSNGFVSDSKFGTFEPLAARVLRPTACELTPTIRTRQTSACSGKPSPKFSELWVPDCEKRHGSAFGANGTQTLEYIDTR